MLTDGRWDLTRRSKGQVNFTKNITSFYFLACFQISTILAGNIKLPFLTENKFVFILRNKTESVLGKRKKRNILIYDPALDPLFHLKDSIYCIHDFYFMFYLCQYGLHFDKLNMTGDKKIH